MDIIAPEIRNMKTMAPATERFRTTRVGIIAVFGVSTSMTMKMTKSTANVTNRPMIFGADHEDVEPPHWRARMRLIIEGTKKKIPTGSRFLICAPIVSFSCLGDGMLRKKKMARIVKLPIGKLM